MAKSTTTKVMNSKDQNEITQLTETLFAVEVPKDAFNPQIDKDKIFFDSYDGNSQVYIDVEFPFNIVGGVDNLGKHFATSGMSEKIQEIIEPLLVFKFSRLVIIESKAKIEAL